MEKGHGGPVMDYFQDLEDPRIERSKRHRLPDIVAIAICAVICGADSYCSVTLGIGDTVDGVCSWHPGW